MQRTIIRLGILLALVGVPVIAHAGVGGTLGGGFVPPTKMGGASGGGDITDVIAGVGLTGGATVGAATLTVDTTYVQRRVSGTCLSTQKLLSVNADGSVNCATDADSGGDITSVGATTNGGLTGGATVGAALLGLLTTCSDQQVLKWTLGTTTWGCAADATGAGTLTGTLTTGNVPVATGASTLGTGSWTDTGTALSASSLVTLAASSASPLAPLTVKNTGTGQTQFILGNAGGTNDTYLSLLSGTATGGVYLNASGSLIHSTSGAVYFRAGAQYFQSAGAVTSLEVAPGTWVKAYDPLIATSTLAVTGLTTATGGVTTPANLTTTGTGALVVAGAGTISGAASIAGAASTLKFFGGTGSAKPTVTGQTLGAGTADMLGKLATLGLVTDTTTLLSPCTTGFGLISTGTAWGCSAAAAINGTLTAGRVPRATGAATLADSNFYDAGSDIFTVNRTGFNTLFYNSASQPILSFDDAKNAYFSGGTLALQSGTGVKWSSTTAPSGAADVGLGRNGVGILEVNTGTAGVKAQIVASIVTASSYVDSAGKVQFAGGLVDKSTVPTLSGCTVGSTISGGGTFFRLVFGAGTNSTTCVVTMPATANTQTCGVTMSDTKAGYPIISAASTTTITISSSAPTNLQGLTAYVHCGNNP